MDKESAHKRFLQAIDYLRDNGKARTHEEIALLSYTSRPNVSSAISGNPRYVTEPFLKRFAAAYSDYINEEWLLTGEGEMIVPDKSLKPHYDAKASAGFMDGISEGKMSAEFRSMAPGMKNYDFSIDVNGDSMAPEIKDGDIIMCRVATDRLNPPIGKICVLDTKEGFVVKVIKSVNEDNLTLHSLNPVYHDYDIDLNSILNIAEVVGLTRSFI